VTFTSDPNVFYATAASGGRTWLVHGDRAARTLVAIRDGVECPSVSPDGTHIAYKKIVSTTPTTTWTVAVLDLATNDEVVLPEPNSVDDQVEWLNDSTVIYGVLRADGSGDSDVWSAPADGSAAPSLLIEHAWSPAVIR
jgi:Tol biopolymer transport system component